MSWQHQRKKKSGRDTAAARAGRSFRAISAARWPQSTGPSPPPSRRELGRQQHEIELIASENIVSRAVLEAQGSVLTNKYAEGYPGRRYYGGCQFVDEAEALAITRAKDLFGCSFANVQPHSGAQANQAVFFALLQPGDTFMGSNLAAGGHLTHGSPVNQSGKWFHVVPYGVSPDDHLIDYDEVERIAPTPSVRSSSWPAAPPIRGSSTSRASAPSPISVGACFMVDMAHFAGLVAGGVHPSPAATCPCRDDHHPQDACAARAAGWSSPMTRIWARRSTPPCFRAFRAGR